MNLEDENIELKRKLSIAKSWMEKEFKKELKNISMEKIELLSIWDRNNFFSENVEEIISTSVESFFWEFMILNTPKIVIENIISAEVLFYNQRQNKFADGLGIISSYHKSSDNIIEESITKPFRKFAIKSWVKLNKNDPLEKTLDLVVNSGYILGISRLYHIISLIKNSEFLYDYTKCFSDFLNNYNYIKEVLLDDDFYSLLSELVLSDVLWKKRHIWTITYEETKRARTILIWDLKEQNCILYKLIKMGQVDV